MVLGLLVGLLAVAAASAFAYGHVESGRTTPLSEPTGLYDVGRASFHWVDPSRGETFTKKKGDERKLMAARSHGRRGLRASRYGTEADERPGERIGYILWAALRARVLGGGTLHQAVEDICWIYLDRDLAENLRRHTWRKARREVIRQGPLERKWISHRGRPPVHLTRGGVEVKLPGGVQTQSWERVQSQVRARRS